jgi:hypothetical protein
MRLDGVDEDLAAHSTVLTPVKFSVPEKVHFCCQTSPQNGQVSHTFTSLPPYCTMSDRSKEMGPPQKGRLRDQVELPSKTGEIAHVLFALQHPRDECRRCQQASPLFYKVLTRVLVFHIGWEKECLCRRPPRRQLPFACLRMPGHKSRKGCWKFEQIDLLIS